MYSAHNEEKSVVSERCIRNWKDEIHKCMTSMSKRVYIDKLDDLVIKYNNTYQSTIKMKHVNVTLDYILTLVKLIKILKLICWHLRISKYKNIFIKFYTQNWSEEVFVIEIVRNTVPWTYKL